MKREDFNLLKRPGRPFVALQWDVHFCPRHIEPLRAQWPKGAAPLMLFTFEKAVALRTIQSRVTAADDSLDLVLREFSPICCLLGDSEMTEITKRALTLSDRP